MTRCRCYWIMTIQNSSAFCKKKTAMKEESDHVLVDEDENHEISGDSLSDSNYGSDCAAKDWSTYIVKHGTEW